MMTPPVASYRLQLTPTNGFDAARRQLDRLQGLGISHLYLSPVTEALPGSTHGYDVVDHTRVRAELGGLDGLTALLDALADRRMAAVIDHVPNHMAVDRAALNRPWWEMLRDGPGSPGARWFDVDWAAAGGKVLLPVLGAPLDEAVVVHRRRCRRAARRRAPLPAGRRHQPLACRAGAGPPALPAAPLAAARAERAAVLHHRQPGRRPCRARRGGRRRRHGAAPPLRAPGFRRCPGRPCRRSRRPAGLPAWPPRRRRRPLAARGEDPRARRGGAAGVARRRHDRLRARPGPRARPARLEDVGRHRRPLDERHRRRPAVPRVGGGGQGRGARRWVATRAGPRRGARHHGGAAAGQGRGCPGGHRAQRPSAPLSHVPARRC